MTTMVYEVKTCDLCQGKCSDEFVDGVTKLSGLWGNMCADCFRRYGIGLGTGVGQRYEKKMDDSGKNYWKKVEG